MSPEAARRGILANVTEIDSKLFLDRWVFEVLPRAGEILCLGADAYEVAQVEHYPELASVGDRIENVSRIRIWVRATVAN